MKKAVALGAGTAALASGVLVSGAQPASAWQQQYYESFNCGPSYGVRQWGFAVSDTGSETGVWLNHHCEDLNGRTMRVRVKYQDGFGQGVVRYESMTWDRVAGNRDWDTSNFRFKAVPTGSRILWTCVGIHEGSLPGDAWNLRQASSYASDHTDPGCSVMDFWSDSSIANFE
jgi:hypothetical protein